MTGVMSSSYPRGIVFGGKYFLLSLFLLCLLDCVHDLVFFVLVLFFWSVTGRSYWRGGHM